MEELKRLIGELKELLGVKSGDKAMTSDDAGDAGQMLDDLIYDQDGSAWKALRETDARDREWHHKQHPEQEYDEKHALSYRVTQAAQHYLVHLQSKRTS